MRRLRSLFALTVFGTLGCNGAELAALENIRDARLAERATLQQRAKDIDSSDQRLARMEADFARVSVWRSDGDQAARMKAISGRLGGARASYVRDGGDWAITLTGTGGAPGAMAALGRLQAPGFVVTRIEAGTPAWSAALRTRDADIPATAGSTLAGFAVPKSGLFPSARRDALHEEIAGIEHEIIALRGLLGSAAKLDLLQAVIDAELAALESDPARLGRVLAVVQPLFAGGRPLLASGTFDVSATGYSAGGVASLGVTGATFASIKPPGWDLRRLEGASIEMWYAFAK